MENMKECLYCNSTDHKETLVTADGETIIDATIIEDPPYSILDSFVDERSHKVITLYNPSQFVAKDWYPIPAWHCIVCKKPYDKNHKEKGFYRASEKTFFAYNAKTGYCPECAKKLSDTDRWREEQGFLSTDEFLPYDEDRNRDISLEDFCARAS